MPFRVLVTDRAEVDIRSVDEWWREHRSAAEHLFREELAAALALLGGLPLCGRRYPHASVPHVRRLLLNATRFHVYYRAKATPCWC